MAFLRLCRNLSTTVPQWKPSDPAVIVHCQPGSTFLSLFLPIKGATHRINKERVSPFETTLKSVASLAEIGYGKQFEVSLLNGEGPDVNKPKRPGTINSHAFQNGDVLVIGDMKHRILVNPPTVLGIVVPNNFAQGTEIRPALQLENVADESMLKFEWRRVREGETETGSPVVSTSKTYEPTEDDVGHRLSFSAAVKYADGSTGNPVTVCPLCQVDSPMPAMGYVAQAKHTPDFFPVDSQKMRVVSYNILGDLYAKDNETYSYCERKALTFGYRDAILCKELPAYHADFVCLQEVEDTRFHCVLKPVMETHGYDGRLFFKFSLREGMATFWRKDRYILRHCKWHNIQDEFLYNPLLQEFHEAMPFRHRSAMKARNTVFQLLHLTSKADGREVILVNTHLFYHPLANDMRLIMSYVIMIIMADYKKQVIRTSPSKLAPLLLLCGDFNSSPEQAVHEIVTTGTLHPTHPNRISADNRDYITHQCNHDLKFGAALPNPHVPYTNYTRDFVGLLDNVYFGKDSMQLLNVVPLPEEPLKEFTALPSVRYPSDHLPVIADLSWEV